MDIASSVNVSYAVNQLYANLNEVFVRDLLGFPEILETLLNVFKHQEI